MVDGGTFVTKPDASLPNRLLAIHALLDELIALHQPDLVAVERLFFSRNAQTAFAVGQARGVVLLAAAQAEVPGARGHAERGQARGHGLRARGQGAGRADGRGVPRPACAAAGRTTPPDALAIAIWAANAERPGVERRSSVLDRASVNPMRRRTGTATAREGYERAVRKRSRERQPRGRSARPSGDRLARRHRRGGRASTRSSSRSAASATACTPRRPCSPRRAPGSRLKLFTHHVVREDLQALYGFRTAEELGFFGLLLTVTGVGPKVAMAIVGSRPTAELQLAIMQQDQAVLVSIPGIGKKLAERVIFELKEKVAAAGVAAIGVAGSPARRRGRRRRRAPGARLLAAGGA